MPINPLWKNFLFSKQAVIHAENGVISFPTATINDQVICPIVHLGVLKLTGIDSATFLQGQITCNVNDLTESQSCFAALCNPKGRVITTFLLIKTGNDFLMVVPMELLALVHKKLQHYLLRAKVVITDESNNLCLFGVHQANTPANFLTTTQSHSVITVNLAQQSSHLLYLAPVELAIFSWQQAIETQSLSPANSDLWRYYDISAGIPWLNLATTEEFIPQMLNIDKLGGISFKKGCYTGQEIVARTHYLGQAKREMFLAECDINQPIPAAASVIIDAGQESFPVVGKVLSAEAGQNSYRLLIILASTGYHADKLQLKDGPQNKIKLLPL
ncbi:MAG: folate-binding protein [Methylococcaceae bacterium]|jgi:hypothetical protein